MFGRFTEGPAVLVAGSATDLSTWTSDRGGVIEKGSSYLNTFGRVLTEYVCKYSDFRIHGRQKFEESKLSLLYQKYELERFYYEGLIKRK